MAFERKAKEGGEDKKEAGSPAEKEVKKSKADTLYDNKGSSGGKKPIEGAVGHAERTAGSPAHEPSHGQGYQGDKGEMAIRHLHEHASMTNRQNSERSGTHHRHQAEHAEMAHRHAAERHKAAGGNAGDMHARHQKEMQAAQDRHEDDIANMHDRHLNEAANLAAMQGSEGGAGMGPGAGPGTDASAALAAGAPNGQQAQQATEQV